MEIRGLGYIGFHAQELPPWRRFAEEVIGLMPADDLPGVADDGTLRYRIDDRSWRVAVHPSEESGLAYVGWELADRAAFEAAVDHLRACSVSLDPDGDAASRGVSELARFVDRYGFAHELFYGAPTCLDRPFLSPAGLSGFVTENGMGHVLFIVPDAHEAEAYYTRLFSLKTTDRMDMGTGKRTIFMRARERHHSIAVTDVLPTAGFHHLMLETRRMEDVGRAWERVAESKTPVMMTLGQHANDPMLSFYVVSPSGVGLELGYDGTLVDESAWVVREVGPNELWGHRGAAMDDIEAGGGRS